MNTGLLTPQAFFDLKLFPLTDELIAGVQSGKIPESAAARLKQFILAESERRTVESILLAQA